MALIKCPECGNEVSDSAVNCPKCGFSIAPVKQENTTILKKKSNKSFVIAVVIVLLIVICGFFGINKIRYEYAIKEMKAGNIAKAKTTFEALGDYEKAEEYADELTSKIEGVSDEAYYYGVQLIEKYSGKDFKKELA